MSTPADWAAQPYLDLLRPDRGWRVRVAIFTAYSADITAIGASLFAMAGRNNDKGSGTAADFAEALECMRGRFRILLQHGRLHRMPTFPRIAAVLDQFLKEIPYDEASASWHPKIALVGYDGPNGERSWRLWTGSRNLTKSRDLDLGLLIDGEARRRKGAVDVPGIVELGRRLAEIAALPDHTGEMLARELGAIRWRAPDGIRPKWLKLWEQGGRAVPAPVGAVDEITIVSPFLTAGFVRQAARWGGPTCFRTIVSTLPAIRSLSSEAKVAIAGFSRILMLAPPNLEPDIDDPALPKGAIDQDESFEAEPRPVSLHAKLYAFRYGERLIMRIGSANATERAWTGRNAEVMAEIECGPGVAAGLARMTGAATPIDRVILDEPAALADDDPARLLETRRRSLMSQWKPRIARLGTHFVLHADIMPEVTSAGVVLAVGLATGSLTVWTVGAVELDLGHFPLAQQTDLIQVRLSRDTLDCGWMQRVTVAPAITPDRDRAAIGSYLGVRAFYDWMRGLLSGQSHWDAEEPWDRPARIRPDERTDGSGLDALTLEDILVAWSRDPDAFKRADARFTVYLKAVLDFDEALTVEERESLQGLGRIWTLARSALIDRQP